MSNNIKLKDSLFSYDELIVSEVFSNRKLSSEYEKVNDLQEIKINANIADKIIKPHLILEEREKKDL